MNYVVQALREMKENKYSQAVLHHRQKMNILKKHRKHYQYMQMGLGPVVIKRQASEPEYDLKKVFRTGLSNKSRTGWTGVQQIGLSY